MSIDTLSYDAYRDPTFLNSYDFSDAIQILKKRKIIMVPIFFNFK